MNLQLNMQWPSTVLPFNATLSLDLTKEKIGHTKLLHCSLTEEGKKQDYYLRIY
jgi:hypothetical protein